MASLCGVSLRRNVAGELDADEWTAPAGGISPAALAPDPEEETTNTERGDTGSLGGVEGGEDADDAEAAGAGDGGDGATCLAGVAGADWIARAG